MKITKKHIDDLDHPASGQAIYWDKSLQGFGVRVTPSRMTYIAQGRVAGRTVRVTLGRHGPLTPNMARKQAQKRLGEMAQGIDANRRTRAERLAGVTLEQAYEAYIASKTLSPNTLRDYERAIRVGFASWRTMPLIQITGGMVNRRFDEITKDGRGNAPITGVPCSGHMNLPRLVRRVQPGQADLRNQFWSAPFDAPLDRKTVAAGLNRSTGWLELLATKGGGPPYLKCGSHRVLYVKRDVLEWWEKYTSTRRSTS